FAFVNLVVGSSAFVIGGILVPLAADLGIGLASAGQAMTAYALSTAVLAPLMLLLTGRWSRRHAMVVALLLFAGGSAVCASAANLPLLLAGRVLMGAGAVFTPIAAGIAVALVPPEQMGRALSRVFIGMSLSYVVGVPLGSWMGLAYGWHAPLWLFTGLTLATAAWLAFLVPARLQAPGASFEGVGALLVRRDVLAVLALTLAYFVAIFAVFSYIGPVMQALVPMSPQRQALTLALFGVAGVVGTVLGGFLNDRLAPRPLLAVQLSMLGFSMSVLPLTAGSWPALMAALATWGVAGFGMMTPQQARLAALAPRQAPLLLSLNASMLYLGTALGAVVGGGAVTHLGPAQLGWVGVPFVALGLAILRFGHTSGAAAITAREEHSS
ncbi:MAG TPA: MFS transporter, partial [Burkholderiaceae bacterium]|nr:MFS transporter [Burkholderiaceae bacterium]